MWLVKILALSDRILKWGVIQSATTLCRLQFCFQDLGEHLQPAHRMREKRLEMCVIQACLPHVQADLQCCLPRLCDQVLGSLPGMDF